MMNEDIIIELYEKGLIRFGDFTLSSGKKSIFYINLRILPSYPTLFKRVMEEALIHIKKLSFDAVCGVATGGIPFAAYIAFNIDAPLIYVRKKKKEYGSRDLLVGVPFPKVLIVDDVATTGKSLEHVINVLQQHNVKEISIVVLILRNKSVKEKFESKGIKFNYLANAQHILSVLYKHKKINHTTYEQALRELT